MMGLDPKWSPPRNMGYHARSKVNYAHGVGDGIVISGIKWGTVRFWIILGGSYDIHLIMFEGIIAIIYGIVCLASRYIHDGVSAEWMNRCLSS